MRLQVLVPVKVPAQVQGLVQVLVRVKLLPVVQVRVLAVQARVAAAVQVPAPVQVLAPALQVQRRPEPWYLRFHVVEAIPNECNSHLIQPSVL